MYVVARALQIAVCKIFSMQQQCHKNKILCSQSVDYTITHDFLYSTTVLRPVFASLSAYPLSCFLHVYHALFYCSFFIVCKFYVVAYCCCCLYVECVLCVFVYACDSSGCMSTKASGTRTC